MKKNEFKKLLEIFGEPIGRYAGDAPEGVRNEPVICPVCKMMFVDKKCGCEDSNDVCPTCGMMPVDGKCGCVKESVENTSCSCHESDEINKEPCEECGLIEFNPQPEPPGVDKDSDKISESKKKKGPSKKTAKKILRGTKTFAQKMKKVSGWAEDPAAAAAWMMHKATGKWPSEK